MRRFPAIIFVSAVPLFAAFAVLGAGPYQAERPPQPFFQDFFSGTVLLEGSPPPEGTLLIACIDDCGYGFESPAYPLKADGSFTQLEVKPLNKELVGHTITFYLENEFGRIQALESRPYIGVFDFYVQDLTFVDPMPTPEPTPLPNQLRCLTQLRCLDQLRSRNSRNPRPGRLPSPYCRWRETHQWRDCQR